MSDVWSKTLHTASFGGVVFDCLATEDSIARAIVRHTYPGRDGGDLQDMGAEPRVTRCRLCFWERPAIDGEPGGTHLERFAAFKAAVDAGRVQDFVHPITGTYRALVEEFTFDTDAGERDTILGDVTFVEDTTEPARFDPGALVTVDAGLAAVAAVGAMADAAAVEAGIPETPGADVASTVEGWEGNPDITVRDVNLQLQKLSAKIDSLIEDYQLATDPSAYPLLRSLHSLNYSARRAAILFRQSQPQVISLTLAAAQPLRVLAAETYGADGAEAGYAEMMRLNDIDDPSLIPAGTTLQAPSPSQRRGTARRAS